MTVAAGSGLSLPARVEGVELNVAQTSSDRVLLSGGNSWSYITVPLHLVCSEGEKLWVRAKAEMPFFNCASACMLYV